MTNRSELLQRVFADKCELCGSKEKVEVHHIRKLADLEKPGRKEKPVWVKQMAARRRKTLVVCRKCHEEIHAGTSTASFRKQGPESRMTQKWSRPVREEDNGKGLQSTSPGAYPTKRMERLCVRLLGMIASLGNTQARQLTELYRALRLYVNCFQPSMKLLSKQREGKKVRYVYDPAKTPLQRLLLSGALPAQKQQEQFEVAQALDPIRLFQ
jgi:hypothetical protein